MSACVQALLNKYSSKGIPLILSPNLSRTYELNKKIIYREKSSTFQDTSLNKYITNDILFGSLGVLSFILFIVLLKLFNIF